jgi:hypothetical protein
MFRRYGTNARHRYKASDNTKSCALPTGAGLNNITMAVRHRDSGAKTPALVKPRAATGNSTKDGNA